MPSLHLDTIRMNQREYDKSAKHIPPIGFAHHMTPASISTLFSLIGYNNIENAEVMDIGCGQGYVLYHFLAAGAKKVIGTEIDEMILKQSVPLGMYNKYVNMGRVVELRTEDFAKKRSHVIADNTSIVTMFIGDVGLVERLLRFFDRKHSLTVIAFMVPTRGFDDYLITRKVESGEWILKQFSLALSGSNEKRLTYVIHRVGG